MGYYDGSNWQTYMDDKGNFFLNGTAGSLNWNSSEDALSVVGEINATNITAEEGTISGFRLSTNAISAENEGLILNAGTSTTNASVLVGGVINIENKTDLTPSSGSITPTVSNSLSAYTPSSQTGATAESAPSYSNTTGITSTDTSPPSFNTTSGGDYSSKSATISGTISAPTVDSTTTWFKSVINYASSVAIHRVEARIKVILQKSTTGSGGWTDVGTWSYLTTNTGTSATLSVSGTAQNWSISFTLENGMHYRVISKLTDILSYAYVQSSPSYNSQITAHFGTGIIATPTLTMVGDSNVAFSEITKGGFQVVTDDQKSVKIPTHGTGDQLEVTGSISATGNITGLTGTTSDSRLKENVKLIPDALDKIKGINGVTFDWREGFENVHNFKGSDVGVIAQEVEYVFPEIVKMNNQTGYRGVKYDKLPPLLIEAIKDLSKKVDKLEKEIKQLKGQ